MASVAPRRKSSEIDGRIPVSKNTAERCRTIHRGDARFGMMDSSAGRGDVGPLAPAEPFSVRYYFLSWIDSRCWPLLCCSRQDIDTGNDSGSTAIGLPWFSGGHPLADESRRINTMFQPPALQFRFGHELDRTKLVSPETISSLSPVRSSPDSRARSLMRRLIVLLGARSIRTLQISGARGAELRLLTRTDGSVAIGDSLRESPITSI